MMNSDDYINVDTNLRMFSNDQILRDTWYKFIILIWVYKVDRLKMIISIRMSYL